MVTTMKHKDAQGKTVESEFLEASDLKALDERLSKIDSTIASIGSTSPLKGRSDEDYYCEDCETYTRNPFEHLKKHPEKHGLLKVVEKVVEKEVEVPRKGHKTAAQYMDCPNCSPEMKKELLKRGGTPPKPKGESKKGGVDLP